VDEPVKQAVKSAAKHTITKKGTVKSKVKPDEGEYVWYKDKKVLIGGGAAILGLGALIAVLNHNKRAA